MNVSLSLRLPAIWNESVPIKLNTIHSAGSMGWPFSVLKYKYFFQIKCNLSNGTRKLLWFELTKMLIAVLKSKFILSFVIIFGTISFPVESRRCISVTLSSCVWFCVRGWFICTQERPQDFG